MNALKTYSIRFSYEASEETIKIREREKRKNICLVYNKDTISDSSNDDES